ncbi:hypothetical protein P9875_08055 [Janthinobacterium rivuli]|uniref:Uncharacterized protein n=1 Tax=Janthinobacterium rivuli TaxID=2751478 RepID=A0ABY8I849_9BURK|nr:hypothetical protein [Janthinobacterium rivuli]WFR81109.1 hypothetical protein P9875_08055 [Janthinobacterium rivuli]
MSVSILDMDKELKIAVGRIVLLEAALGTLIKHQFSKEQIGELVTHLEIENARLLQIGLPNLDGSILKSLKTNL